MNLADGLKYEIERCQELLGDLAELRGIPNVNVAFYEMSLKQDLNAATEAMLNQDVVAMLQVYNSLKEYH